MRPRPHLVLPIVLIAAAPAWAGPPVTGRVLDADGDPVAGAVITVEGSDATARTGADGRFVVDAPDGAVVVVETDADELALGVVVGDRVGDIVLETITIVGEAPAPAPGAARLAREDLQRVPGAGGDVARALTVMPSVLNLQFPVGYTGIAIRGSAPQDAKILVDGFDVPLLFHDLAFRTIIPPEAIGSLDFVPGGFDVSHGRATSGVVLLDTRAGDARRSTQSEVSVIDGGLIAQGPAGRRTTYMVALRRSMIDLLIPAMIPDDADLSMTTVPRYYDGQVRVDHQLDARWRLTLSGFGADDELELVTSKNDDAADKRLYSMGRFSRVTARARRSGGPWSLDLAVSGLAGDYAFELGTQQRAAVTTIGGTARAEAVRAGDRVEWRVGGEAQVTRWDADLVIGREIREGDPNPSFDPDDTSTRFSGRFWIPDLAAWTAVAADVVPRVRISAGARADRFERADETLVQPRGELTIQLDPAWKLRLAAGTYARPPEYQTELFTEDLRAERSRHLIAGTQWQPSDTTRLQVTVYHSDRSRLVRADAMGALHNGGEGTTYGAELLATHRAAPWFVWLSYGYAHSTRVDAPGMPERRFDFDQPHNLNTAASWRRGRWQLGGRFQLYSGLPWTPALGGVLDSDRNVYEPINGPVNSQRAPAHHQLDLRVDYAWTMGPMAATAFLDVQNVYMNDSVVTYFHSYDYTQRAALRSLPLVPMLGVRGVL